MKSAVLCPHRPSPESKLWQQQSLDHGHYFQVECANCGARGPRGGSKADARELWVKRGGAS